ncbi:MAG: hypothetical protein LBV68_08565 [Spirochaetaceae bacterium]|jgi:hypothetical protein|nr:hypothetical protein [Spirochaetaceae bacterium]
MGNSQSKLDPETEDQIKLDVMPIVGSMAATIAVGAAVAILSQFLATNYHTSTMTGDTGLHPTEENMAVSGSEISAKNTEASLAKDAVKAKDGDLSAAKTDAIAAGGEATALESGATACRTKAGASDIEVKALKMT